MVVDVEGKVVMGRGRGRVVADIEGEVVMGRVRIWEVADVEGKVVMEKGEYEMTRVADVEMEGAVRGGCK